MMPLAALIWSRVSRLAVLALLGLLLTVPAAVLGDRTASDGWHRVPGAPLPLVRITSDDVLDLYPGASKKLTLTLRNSDRRHGVVVRRLRIRAVGTTNLDCAASHRNLAVRQYAGGAIRIPAGGSRTVTALLSMPNTVSDACQRVVFRLRYRADAARIGKGRTPVEAVR